MGISKIAVAAAIGFVVGSGVVSTALAVTPVTPGASCAGVDSGTVQPDTNGDLYRCTRDSRHEPYGWYPVNPVEPTTRPVLLLPSQEPVVVKSAPATGKKLPLTGPPALGVAVVAGVLLVVGSAVAVVARRRRTRFQA